MSLPLLPFLWKNTQLFLQLFVLPPFILNSLASVSQSPCNAAFIPPGPGVFNSYVWVVGQWGEVVCVKVGENQNYWFDGRNAVEGLDLCESLVICMKGGEEGKMLRT